MKQLLVPARLLPRELDDYLSRGWFRIAQTLMTCRAIVTRDALRSTIWTRVSLREYAPKRSQRRVMRRVEERFGVRVGPARLDATREALYQRYLLRTDGTRAPTLRYFLFEDEPDRGLFNTWEVSVWDGDVLVGFSWFDLGEDSIESLIAVFAPEVAGYSLGVYSLLREVQYGVETGRAFFYAGYILYGDPMMDYKLRTGGVSFMDDRDGAWLTWEGLMDPARGYVPPLERVRGALEVAAQRLLGARVGVAWMENPMFEVPAHAPGLRMCLTQPLALVCSPERQQSQKTLLIWDVEREQYEVVRGVRVLAQSRVNPQFGLEMLMVVEQVGVSREVDEVVEVVWGLSGG